MVSHIVRDAVLARDGGKCTRCGAKGSLKNPLQMHHIVFRCHGGKATYENLTTLCQSCHRELHHSIPSNPKHKGKRRKK